MENAISVCIPCIEKHIPFLSNCISSINNQSLKPMEIIVSISNIKDMESTRKIINNIIKSTDIYMYVIFTSDNKYAGENRNICTNFANGDIISFIDADDIMHKDRIKILHQIFKEYPDYIGVLHYFVENSTKDDEEIFDKKYIEPYSFTDLLHFGHSTFRKKIFEEYKYSNDPRGQDVKFIALILPKYLKKLLIYKRTLTFYMSNNSSYWNSNL